MGSKTAKLKASDYGKIVIEANKTCYHPGEDVKLMVTLILHESYTGDKLMLLVQGKEGYKSRRAGTFKRNLLFLNAEFIIISFQNKGILPGQYRFPFIFRVDAQMPSSFNYTGKTHTLKIGYKVTGFLNSADKNIPTLMNSQAFRVSSVEADTPCNEWSAKGTLNQYLVMNKSKMGFKCDILKSSLDKNEDLILDVHIDNSDCHRNFPLKGVVVQLWSNIQATRRMKIQMKRKNQVFQKEICFDTIPDFKTQHLYDIKFPIRIPLSEIEKESFLEYSTEGSHIKNSYKLLIYPNYLNYTKISSKIPKIKIPISIHENGEIIAGVEEFFIPQQMVKHEEDGGKSSENKEEMKEKQEVGDAERAKQRDDKIKNVFENIKAPNYIEIGSLELIPDELAAELKGRQQINSEENKDSFEQHSP